MTYNSQTLFKTNEKGRQILKLFTQTLLKIKLKMKRENKILRYCKFMKKIPPS